MKEAPWILGINASHNGSVCLLKGDTIVVAIQEERLTRRKGDRIYAARPCLAVAYCLATAGIRVSDLDLVAVGIQGAAASPEHNIYLNPQLDVSRNEIGVRVYSHHLCHAASVFATSGFRQSAILVIDGLGSPVEDLMECEKESIIDHPASSWESVSMYIGENKDIRPLEKHMVPHGQWLQEKGGGMPLFGSIGGMYSAVAQQIFGDPMEAGKVMGLAPLGRIEYYPDEFFQIGGGSFRYNPKVPMLFPGNERWPDRSREYANLAASVQHALENAVLSLTGSLYEKTNCKNLCYAGGVALNGKANERIVRETLFEDIYIIPAADDSGASIGAAYLALWESTGVHSPQRLKSDALGRRYSSEEIGQAIKDVPFVRCKRMGDPIEATVERLCDGQLVGWFQGGSEFGPRALGQRSILCDPRLPDAKEKLNRVVKGRESFRPFAPAILHFKANEWFELDGTEEDNPFMLRIMTTKPQVAGQIPAVVHADGTARVQTVSPVNGPFYELISRFFEKTGIPMLLNTSFNLQSSPIVEEPEDAIWSYLVSGLDVCVLEGFLIGKKQPEKKGGRTWSLLDLVPELIIGKVAIDIEVNDHRLVTKELGRAGGTVNAICNWGKYTQHLPGLLFTVLVSIDGKRTGRDILKLWDTTTADDEALLIQSLERLRSWRVIRFKTS
jgi:carbamoyltransferase